MELESSWFPFQRGRNRLGKGTAGCGALPCFVEGFAEGQLRALKSPRKDRPSWFCLLRIAPCPWSEQDGSENMDVCHALGKNLPVEDLVS